MILKYFTPFIWSFPVCLIFAVKTWLGHFIEYNLAPARSVLFISIGFTMLITDLLLKFLIGKDRVQYIWIVETIIIVILCVIILPQISAEHYT